MARTIRERRARRHRRVRKTITGTPERPRLVVFRSLRHISAQVVDDTANNGSGRTLCSATTACQSFSAEGDKKARAKSLGKELAEKAKAAGIERVVFDRGGYLYHGRVRALAEGAREGGLQF